MQAVINEEVDKMLKDGVIEPSRSPWSPPVVIVKQKDGKYQFCIDFRKGNDVSIKDAYPSPYISTILDKLRNAKYISTIDLKQGYWQIPLAEESRPITVSIQGHAVWHNLEFFSFSSHISKITRSNNWARDGTSRICIH